MDGINSLSTALAAHVAAHSVSPASILLFPFGPPFE